MSVIRQCTNILFLILFIKMFCRVIKMCMSCNIICQYLVLLINTLQILICIRYLLSLVTTVIEHQAPSDCDTI